MAYLRDARPIGRGRSPRGCRAGRHTDAETDTAVVDASVREREIVVDVVMEDPRRETVVTRPKVEEVVA
jgi:hypothetical protein